MLGVSLFFNAAFLLYIINNRYRAIYILPLFVVVSNAMSIFMPLGIRGGHNYLTLLVILVCVILLINSNVRIVTFNKWYLALGIYFFTLILLSSDPIASFQGVLTLLLGLSMLSIGYYYIETGYEFDELNKSLIYIMIAFILNFILANVIKLGDDAYGIGIYGGALTREYSFFAAICVLMIPLVKEYTYKYRVISYVLAFIVFIILFLLVRRSPILNVILGYSTFFILVSIFSGRNIAKYVTALLLFAAISAFMVDRYADRITGMVTDTPIAEESRTKEIIYTFSEMISFNNYKNSMIGQEIFNYDATRGVYGFGRLGERRSMHTTLARIMHGTGIVGIILFILFIFNIHVKYLEYISHLKDKPEVDYLRAVYYVLIFSLLINLYTLGIFTLSFTTLSFLYLGAVLRQLHERCLMEDADELLDEGPYSYIEIDGR